MKKVLLAIMIMVLAIVSCGEKKETATGGGEKEKELKVGLNSTFAPFEYIKDGQLTGFDVDLINEIGKNLGYKVTFIDQAFDGLIPALKAGKIDVIVSGMSATEERKKSVDFTDEYFTSTQVYLRKKGNTSVTSKDNLKGKRIGVQLGTIQEIEAKKIDGASVVPNESTVNVLMELNAGKNDVVILENIVAFEYLKNYPELEVFFEEPLDAGMAMAFDKGKHTELITQINDELKKLKENGKYDELRNKYGLNVN